MPGKIRVGCSIEIIRSRVTGKDHIIGNFLMQEIHLCYCTLQTNIPSLSKRLLDITPQPTPVLDIKRYCMNKVESKSKDRD